MITTPSSLGSYLAQERVKRWHIVAMTREQTLLEHAAAVTFIALAIVEKIMAAIPGISEGNRIYTSYATMKLAMTHDAQEVFIGDVPSAARKRFIRDELLVRDLFYTQYATIIASKIGGGLFSIIETSIKIADIVDAIRFCEKYGVNSPHKDRVLDGLKKSLHEQREELKARISVKTKSGQLVSEIFDMLHEEVFKEPV